MANTPAAVADDAGALVTEPRNKFVEAASGRFMQADPEPLVITDHDKASLDQVVGEVRAAVSKIGSGYRKFR